MRRFIEFFQGAERGVEGVKSRRGGEEARKRGGSITGDGLRQMQACKKGSEGASERASVSLPPSPSDRQISLLSSSA